MIPFGMLEKEEVVLSRIKQMPRGNRQVSKKGYGNLRYQSVYYHVGKNRAGGGDVPRKRITLGPRGTKRGGDTIGSDELPSKFLGRVGHMPISSEVAEPPVIIPDSPENKLLKFLSLQNSKGTYKMTEELCSLLGLDWIGKWLAKEFSKTLNEMEEEAQKRIRIDVSL